MRTGNTSWQFLDYLKLVERAKLHRQAEFKIFRFCHHDERHFFLFFIRFTSIIQIITAIIDSFKEVELWNIKESRDYG